MELTDVECIISHHLPQSLGGTAEVRQTFKEIQHREEAATSCNGGRGTPHSPKHTHTLSLGGCDMVVTEVYGRGRQKALIASTHPSCRAHPMAIRGSDTQTHTAAANTPHLASPSHSNALGLK